MASVLRFSDAKAQLAEVLRSRDATLVVGAGASVASGAPLTGELIGRILERFKLVEVEPNAKLFDVGTAVCDTPPYGRLDLVQFVADQFSGLDPSASYRQLPRLRWRALFTTNYDDLIEQTFSSPARVQTLRARKLSQAGLTIPRDNELLLFYLMGSIQAPVDSEDSPVVSWADYHRSVQQRASVLDLIRGILIDGGKFVYVGYSFNDFLLEGVLDEALRIVGPVNMPYGYAIMTDWPAYTGQPYHKLQSRNVVPVDGTFEELAELIGEIADEGETKRAGPPIPRTSPASGKALTVGGDVLRLTEVQAGVFSEAFEVLSDEQVEKQDFAVEDQAKLARDFLRGRSVGWLPFTQGWAFRRAGYEAVLELVCERCESLRPQDNCVFLVHGPAGLGKSVMAGQLAFDVYMRMHVPVLVAKPNWRSRPDFRLLNRFCYDLESQLPSGTNLPRVVLIIDEAELLDTSVPFRATGYMKGQGRAVALVLFARTNEYFRIGRAGGEEAKELWGEPIAIQVPEQLTPEEAGRLIQHVGTLGVWEKPRITNEAFWQDYIGKELGYSFFDSLYSIVEQTKEPLSERVWSEFINLSELAQKAYILIAATHQFGIPLKMEILQRALDVRFAEFEEAVIRADAREVLFTEHQTSNLNLFFRGRTKIISKLVFERAVSERHDQLEVFKTVVAATNPSEMFGVDELDAVRTLLVQVFGSHGFDSRFSPDEVAELFETATSRIQDDVLEHHFGLIERDRRRFLSAREHLERALSLSATLPYDLATLRESPQHIENSLAQVIGELAIEALKRGNEPEASRLFDEARERFLSSRSGRFPNAAAYDAHARMLWTRAQRMFQRGSAERALGLSEALDVVSEGIDNVNHDSRPDLVALQTALLEELGYEEEAITTLQNRVKSAPKKEAARYHVLLARILVSRGKGEPKRKNLNRALNHCSRATELHPQYFPGWKLRAEVYARLHRDDYAGLAELLRSALEYAQEAENNCWVLYKLGVCTFYLEQYEDSVRHFKRLAKVSRGHEDRAGIVGIAGADQGHEGFEFVGRVSQSPSGGLCVESEELKAFGQIYFNPRTQRFYTARVGDDVEFLVGFNYRGLVATHLQQI